MSFQPFTSYHRIIYCDPRTENMSAYQYARALARYAQQEAGEQNVLIAPGTDTNEQGPAQQSLQDYLYPEGNSLHAEIHELLELAHLSTRLHHIAPGDPTNYKDLPLTILRQELSEGEDQQLALAQALTHRVHTLILVEPLNRVAADTQKAIYTFLEKNIKKHPALAGLAKLYIISTTPEVEQRINRDYAAEPQGIPTHLGTYYSHLVQR